MKILFAVASLASIMVLSAGALRAQTAAELLPALKTAAAQSSLYDDGLRPWHLKMNVSLTGPDGKQETGTLEEWHNGREEWRTDYDLPSYHGSVVHNANGVYRTAGLGQKPFNLSYLAEAVLQPLPRPDTLDEVAATVVEPGFRKDLFRCVAVAPKDREVVPEYYFSWPTYCFDPKTLQFEATVQYSLVSFRV